MTISRVLGSIVLAAVVSCGSNGTDGKTGVQGLPGPAGSSGSPGSDGQNGQNGQNGTNGADIALPGPAFYPESITALSDGTLFIGSLGLGQIWKNVPNSAVPTKFVDNLKQVNGVLADQANDRLYACVTDPGATTNNVKVLSFGLADAQQKDSFALPDGTKCNDMVFDAAGNLYVADSSGKIFKANKGTTTMTQWAMGGMLDPSMAGGFGADGIVFDGGTNLFVNNFETGKILRVAINGDGTVGATDEIVVTPPLTGPDGMRALNATTLVVAENIIGAPGKLSRLTIDNAAKTASKTVLANRLDGPTSFVKVGMVYWIAEGQLEELFIPTPMAPRLNPDLPFLVRRLPSFD